jgi:nucleoside-diphosphate-sugar epimerase
MVSINELAEIIAGIAGVPIVKVPVEGPQGVRGRNSDNTRVREILGWQPKVSLEEGLALTYDWVEEQVRAVIQSSEEAAVPGLGR